MNSDVNILLLQLYSVQYQSYQGFLKATLLLHSLQL
jgi:hypothetical protein